MDTNTRQLAALVAQTFERFEAAVLTCLPADKRREVVLSPAWIEFRLAVSRLSGTSPAVGRASARRTCPHRSDGDMSACDHCCLFG